MTKAILAAYKVDEDEYFLIPFYTVFEDENIQTDYKHWFNDLTVTRYNSHGLFPYNPQDDIKEFIKDKTQIVWAIIKRKQIRHRHIGNVSLQKINHIYNTAEIAGVIGEVEEWGKGLMTWAMQSIIDHGVKKLGLNRIWSGTAAVNIGMQKVFEKLGFEQEGVFKDGMFLNGRFVDVIAYGKTHRHEQNKTPDKNYFGTNVLDKIESIRSKNNTNWMDLVRLALETEPKKTKAILKKISEKDKEINNVLQEMVIE